MDTSRLLADTSKMLQQFLDELGFSEIRHLLHDFHERIDGVTYHLRYVNEERVMVPLSFSTDTIRAYVIHISRHVSKRRGNIRQIYFYRLLLRKSLVGGLHTEWYLWESKFRPSSSVSTQYFDVHTSVITPIDDESLNREIKLPADFSDSFYDQIRAWIEVCQHRRDMANASLQGLAGNLPKRTRVRSFQLP